MKPVGLSPNPCGTKSDATKRAGDGRLRILFITQWYPHEAEPTEGVFVREHAKAASLFNEVVVIGRSPQPSAGPKRLRMGEMVADRTEDGIRTIRVEERRLPSRAATQFLFSRAVKHAFGRLLSEEWRPDVIHAHVYGVGPLAARLAESHGIPMVLTEHSSRFIARRVKRRDLRQSRFAMRRAEIVLPVSRHLENAIKSLGIQGRFRVVPNAIDTELFRPPADPGTRQDREMLFVGLLKEGKGVPTLLRAVAHLRQRRRDFTVHIVGDGPRRDHYEGIMRDLRLETVVSFHGRQSKDAVARLMRRCAFYIQPTHYETFGVTFVEAMACGMPVVATQIPVLEEKIDSHRGLLVPPEDPEALADALHYMLDHWREYSSADIADYARRTFSRKAVGSQLDHIYREITHNA